MNWTEGNLARHSRGRGRKDVLLRQKQHFAKARSGVLGNTRHATPPGISFLQCGSSSSRRSARRHRKSSQSPLEQHSGQEKNADRPSKREPLQSSPYFGVKGGVVPRKRRRLTPAAGDGPSIQEKKQRLLLKSDWLGLKMQRPMDVQFAPARSRLSKWSQTHKRHAHLFKVVDSEHDQMRRGHPQALLAGAGNIRVKIGSQGTTDFRQGSSHSRNDVRHQSRNSQVSADSSVEWSPLRPAQLDSGSPRSFVLFSTHRGVVHGCRIGSEHSSQDILIRPSCSAWSGSSCKQPGVSRSGQIVTTSPLIFHPRPQRYELHPMLVSSSPDSEAHDSVLAQVGGQRVVVPAAELEINEEWRAFVVPSNSRSSGTTHWSGSESHPGISPGVSALGLKGISRDDGLKQNTVRFPGKSQTDSVDGLMATSPTKGAQAIPRMDAALKVSSTKANIRVGKPLTATKNRWSSTQGDGGGNEKGGDPSLTGEDPERLVKVRQDKPMRVKHPVATSKPTRRKPPPSPPSKPDEDDAWKQFLFSDSDSGGGKVLQAAIRDAARVLHPSDDSNDTGALEEIETAATKGSYSSEIDTAWPPSINGLSSNCATAGSPTEEWAIPGDSDSVLPMESGLLCPRRQTDLSTSVLCGVFQSSADPSDVDSTSVQPAQSVASARPKVTAKFLAPKQLEIKPADAKRRRQRAPNVTAGAVQENYGQKRRSKAGRPRAGRVDIRDVPDYSGDPIEEIEDEVDLIKLPPPSLFGALEME